MTKRMTKFVCFFRVEIEIWGKSATPSFRSELACREDKYWNTAEVTNRTQRACSGDNSTALICPNQESDGAVGQLCSNLADDRTTEAGFEELPQV